MRISAALLFSAMLLPLLMTSPASAQWNDFWCRCRSDWNRNNCWPAPFTGQDQEAVRGPLAVMASNGWQREMTLADYHFDPETQELNSAGHSRLAWILTHAPAHRRTLFVLGHENPDIVSARISHVQNRASALVQHGQIPGILVTNSAPRGISAGYIDSMNRQRQDNQPAPVLPEIEIIGQ